MLFTSKTLLLAAVLIVPALSRPEKHDAVRMVKRTPAESVSCSPINDDCITGVRDTLACCLYPEQEGDGNPTDVPACDSQYYTNTAACSTAYNQYPTALTLDACRDGFASSMNLDTTANMNAISTCNAVSLGYFYNYACGHLEGDFEC